MECRTLKSFIFKPQNDVDYTILRFQGTELMRVISYLSEARIYQDVTENDKTRYFAYYHRYCENCTIIDNGLSKSRINAL